MKVLPLWIAISLLSQWHTASSQSVDYFHEKLETLAGQFTSLNIPDLEKIQLPQRQADASHVFIYIWLPNTHRPTTASFEANIADYFDIAGAQGRPFDGWCYLRKPEMTKVTKDQSTVGAMRVWALSYNGKPPRRCLGGLPGNAGQLGQTKVFKDPRSGLLSMVRSGHPTRFPGVEKEGR